MINDDWTVQPELRRPPSNQQWNRKVAQDASMASDIIDRYTKALNDIQMAPNDVARRNAEVALKLAVDQGASLFEDIHQGRRYAFSPSGSGYADINNYRWQAGKSSGIIQALRKLKDVASQSKKEFETQTYGMELPDASTLIRRSIGGR